MSRADSGPNQQERSRPASIVSAAKGLPTSRGERPRPSTAGTGGTAPKSTADEQCHKRIDVLEIHLPVAVAVAVQDVAVWIRRLVTGRIAQR